MLAAGFLFGAPLPDRMPLQLVQNLRRAHRDAVRISRHGPAVRLERIASTEFDRVERQRGRRFVDQDLQRRHGLQGSVAAHRPCGHPARMIGHRGDIDFRNIVDPDRGSRRHSRYIRREIGEPAAIQDVVGSECANPAGRAIDKILNGER